MPITLITRLGRMAAWSAVIVALYVLVLLTYVAVANADLYGRLIETETASGVGTSSADSQRMPTVRLVLHRLLEGENAVEASAIIFAYDKPSDLVQAGQREYVAE